MEKEFEACDLKTVGIVCSHVAAGTHPILQAVRTEPTEVGDSGWQFLCNSGQPEDEDFARVWTIEEVLSSDPSLQEWINAPIETTLWRQNKDSSWMIWEAD